MSDDGLQPFLMGFRRYSPLEDNPLPSQHDWLNFKKKNDALPRDAPSSMGLWRVHDELYDLSQFSHPGGWDFLEMTRNTDVTELFESSHYNIEKARKILAKYRVAAAPNPRNCKFTFDEKGFYCQLRNKVNKLMNDLIKLPVPYWKSTECIHDVLLGLFLLFFLAGMHLSEDSQGVSLALLTVAGTVLAFLAICAHNFFHHRNNWRMYSFDLTGNSSYEWRISHVYSHHCFPNSLFDYEATAFSAFICFYPFSHKKELTMYIKTALSLMIVFPLVTSLVSVKRYAMMLVGRLAFRWEFFLYAGLLACAAVVYHSHNPLRLWDLALRWLWMQAVASAVFLHVGLAATHHCPEVWHAGDNSCTATEQMDWGVYQVMAIGSRPDVDSQPLLSSVSFGQHGLHHLFPTVDQYYLQFLYPVYLQTLEDFRLGDAVQAPRRVYSIRGGYQGLFKQMLRSERKPENLPAACLSTS